MVFEEALYINGSQRKMLSIEDVTQLATNSLDLYNEIKNNLFCPECEKPHLTYNSCTTKSNYFSTHNLESHADTCSFKCKRATNHQLELLENDEKSLDRLQNRLKAVILSCFSEKKAARNPFVIENKISKVSTNTENQSERTAVKYAIPKKRITNGLSQADVDQLKIFYGKVRVRCKKHRNGHKLYIFNLTQRQLPMICSIYLSEKVYEHINIKDNDCFNCLISFYVKMEINKQDDKIYYNCILTDSRKMFFWKIDR